MQIGFSVLVKAWAAEIQHFLYTYINWYLLEKNRPRTKLPGFFWAKFNSRHDEG